MPPDFENYYRFGVAFEESAYLGTEETEALRPVLDVARAVEENHVLLQPPAAGGAAAAGVRNMDRLTVSC